MIEEINSTDKDKVARKSMICNHCTFDCENYEKMKEHYKSEFHKYNLNRVTMNLNPLIYSEYLKKKESYQKKMEEMAKLKTQPIQIEKKCDLCKKKFSSVQKYNEHIQSKAHIRIESEMKEKEKETGSIITETQKGKYGDKTTLDDETICLFCNIKHESLEKNIFHMVDIHKLDVPFLFCIENYHKLIELLAKKIFKHKACLTCDTQKFNSYYSLQSHMIDKAHTRISKEDLDEYLYKFYDMKKLLALKDTNVRKMEEFKVLSLRHKVANRLKENKKKIKEEDDDEWEEEIEETEKKQKPINEIKKNAKEKEESDDDYEPMELPNGELLLEDGTVLGSKIYTVYYKQRIHLSKYDDLQKKVKESLTAKRIKKQRIHRNDYRRVRNSLQGSNKSNFQRINSLFKAAPQS